MDKPVSEMTNEEIFTELQQVSKAMKDFYAVGNLKDRNKLVPRYRELRRAYDWSFTIGQKIESNAWQKRWQEAQIKDYDETDNMYLIKNDSGWEVWVDGICIREQVEKVVQVKILPPDPPEDYEQMELALFK